MPPLSKQAASDLILRRHPEWREHQRSWRWLADSLEGGDRYRFADYATDPLAPTYPVGTNQPWYRAGQYSGPVDAQTAIAVQMTYQQIVDRNLVPHRKEMDDRGRDLYAMRLTRTPVPEIVATTVEIHLSKIFAREIDREGSAELVKWWSNVEGRATPTPIRQFMEETVAPLLMTLGQLDILIEHPAAPEDARVETRRDLVDLGLTSAVASIILPENIPYWELDRQGCYERVVVAEWDAENKLQYRVWTKEDSLVYTPDGEHITQGSYEHRFGVVPIVRVFDRRKPRCRNVGRSRYQEIADLQRAIYNARSELILSDILQAHAQLQAPEDFCGSGSEVKIGPDGVLPMKAMKSSQGHTTGYQGFQFLDPPKGAQAEIRSHIHDFRDEADRAGTLAKPAGLTQGSTVAQSGVSKQIDAVDGNAILCRIAEALECAETAIATLALRVLADGEPKPADLAMLEVCYPKQFDLFTATDVATVLDAVQRAASQAGALPETEEALLTRLVTLALPGMPEDELDEIHAEIERFVLEASASWRNGPTPPTPPTAAASGMPMMGDPESSDEGGMTDGAEADLPHGAEMAMPDGLDSTDE